MKFYNITLIFIFLASFSFAQTNTTSDAKSKALIGLLEEVNGGWNTLLKMKDVEYTYVYEDLGKKAKDVSVERYIFNGETSWAKYEEHNVNVMPGKEGEVVQCLIGGKPSITHEGNKIETPEALGSTAFLRHANFYWFTMMYKLSDPGIIATYLGEETYNGVNYDKVSIKYENTGKAADDEYILYFNPQTHLVDVFYFSLPAMGVNKPMLRMELEYEKIDGIYISTTRRGIYPNQQGEYQPGGVYTYSNVKFNNGFTTEDLIVN